MSIAHKKSNRGFTLLELLVVVALIGILLALAAVSFSQAQKKSRNAKRQSDIQKISLSLEDYFGDHHKYPTQLSCLTGTDNTCEVPNDKVYVDPVPVDPQTNAAYSYCPNLSACLASPPTSSYQGYTLTATLEGTPSTYTVIKPD